MASVSAGFRLWGL